jgi:hypothetical protein
MLLGRVQKSIAIGPNEYLEIRNAFTDDKQEADDCNFEKFSD